jgi:hypothetical protein
MNASSVKVSPGLSRSQARNYVILNQLATPGLGTWLAGRKITGALQMLVAVTACVLIILWFLTSLRPMLEAMQGDPYRPDSRTWTYALWGWNLLAVSWLWAGISSLSILKQATPDTPAAKPPRLGSR